MRLFVHTEWLFCLGLTTTCSVIRQRYIRYTERGLLHDMQTARQLRTPVWRRMNHVCRYALMLCDVEKVHSIRTRPLGMCG
ncbi:hypothetical protein F4808DRAFT_420101 [Astrocystis sublimbata]|nr:hypothetical protein F4808DRAFT_420101 [Astrocystis sublimbata]